jgi:hypothetical protein
MLVSTNRTIVHLVAAQPIGGPELAYLRLNLALQRLKPHEFIRPSRQLLKVFDNQRAHRGVTPRCGDPGIAVHVIGNADRKIPHSFTVTRFPWSLIPVGGQDKQRLLPDAKLADQVVQRQLGTLARSSSRPSAAAAMLP